jgi:hypothetical protein
LQVQESFARFEIESEPTEELVENEDEEQLEIIQEKESEGTWRVEEDSIPAELSTSMPKQYFNHNRSKMEETKQFVRDPMNEDSKCIKLL